MGKIMMYAGLGLSVLAVILTVIFKIRKPVYQQAAHSSAEHKKERADKQPAVYENGISEVPAQETTLMNEKRSDGLQ